MLKAASANVLQRNNFPVSLLFFFYFSPLPVFFPPSICFQQYPHPWADREKKSLKTIIMKNSHPMNWKKRALAGAGCLFLWGRGRVDTDADRGGLSVQWHLLHGRWRKKRMVAQKRCFVSAFHAKSLRMEGVFSTQMTRRRKRWNRSIHLSSLSGSAVIPAKPNQDHL